MKLKNLLLTALALICYSNVTFSQNCSTCSYAGWTYYQKIIINNSTNPSALTNYQVKVTLNTQTLIPTKMQSNGADIRFSSLCSGGTNYNYWIESGINTTSTTIWVKVPSIAANTVDTMYLHHGNVGATAASSGSLTFPFFDDFESGLVGWTFSGGTWAISNVAGSNVLGCTNPTAGNGFAALFNTNLGLSNYIVDVSSRNAASSVYGGPMFEHNDFNNYFAYHMMVDAQNTMQSKITGGSANYSISDPAVTSINTWYPWSMSRTPSVIGLTFNGVFTRTLAPAFTDGVGVWAYGGGAGNVYFDNLRVRAYSAVTPTTIPGVQYATSTILAFNTSTNTSCSGSSVTLTASGLNTYTWSTGPITSSIIVTPTINTSYTVTGTNTLVGCTNSIAKTVTVIPNPTITVNSGSICFGQSFMMMPNGAASYTYQGGGMVVTPTVTSSYTVVGTGTNGCISNIATSNVTVNANPTITVNSGSICSGQSFTMVPAGATSYTFEGGGPVKTPTANAGYTVVGSNTAGCVSNIATSNVTVNANPTITVNSGSICSGQSFTMVPSGANTYTFQGGSAVVSPTSNASYTVTGTSTAGCAAPAFATSNVTVNTNPTITVNSGSICSGSSFTMVPSGANSYTFQGGIAVVSPTANASYTVAGTSTAGCVSQGFATSNVTVNAIPVISVNSGSVCAGQSFTMVPSGANTYTFQGGSAVVSPTANVSYTVTGTSTAGCVSQTLATSNITVNSVPVITVNSGSICLGNSFTMVPSGANTYTFEGGNAIVSPTASTNYTLAGTSTAGCMSNGFVTSSVTINAAPLPTVSVNSGSICAGSSFTMVPSGAASYTFQGGSSVISPTANSSYTVVGTNTAGCISQTFATSNVTVNPVPSLSVTPSVTICAGESTTLTASGATSYSWDTGSTSASIAVTPTVSTTYTAVGTNPEGCSSSVSVTVVIDPCTGLGSKFNALTGLLIYPNPNNGHFTVELHNGLNKTVEVSDVTGRIILSGSGDNDKMNINISNLASGIYYVKIQSNNAVEVMKISKQ